MNDPFAYQTATVLAELLSRREVSSVELVDAAIARIEKLDGSVNAVVVRDFDRARAAAREADAALARGDRKPLLGVPLTVKESFNIAGLPTTWGIPEQKGNIAAEDAFAVARFKAAGAVVMGKTNVPYGLVDWQSFNKIYGVTRNPWNLARSPGGSSGGSAAALAAGFTALEFGSDIGGSIRVPAHYCGVFGLKPTYGLVPGRGQALPGNNRVSDLSVSGPLARSAADLDLALGIVAQPDGAMAKAYHLSLPAPRHGSIKDYRVLVIDEHPLVPTRRVISGAVNKLADRLAKSGAHVARNSNVSPDLALASRVYVQLLGAETNRRMPEETRQRVAEAAARLSQDDDSLHALRLRNANLTHNAWIELDEQRARLKKQWEALFQEWDVVLSPPVSTEAFPHDFNPDQNAKRIDIDGREIVYIDQLVWPGIATLAGLPASVAPIDRTLDGMPIGVQIMAGPYEDRTAIAFAGLLEREFGGFVPPPL